MSGAVITNDYGRFAQIPLVLAFDPKISPNAVKLYTILWGYSSAGDRQAFPSRETIAKHLGRSTDTVDRGLKELVAYQAVAIEHAFDRGRQVANVYRILNLGISRPDLFDPDSAGAAVPGKQPAAREQEPEQPSTTGQEGPDEADPDSQQPPSSQGSANPAARGAAQVRPRGRNRAGHGGRTGAEGIYEQEPEEQESSSLPSSQPAAGESSPRTEEDSSSSPVMGSPPGSGDGASAGSAPTSRGVGGGAVVAGNLKARLRAAGIDPGHVDLEAAKDEVLGARMGHRIGNRSAYVAAAIIREPWRWPAAPGTWSGPQRAADGAGGEVGQPAVEAQPGVVRKRVASACPQCGHRWLWWEPATGVEDCPECEHVEDAGAGPDQGTGPASGKVA